MKVAKKRTIVDAVPYEPGMEDGFKCYNLIGEFLGYYPKGKPYPRSHTVPVIITKGRMNEVFDGIWILTDDKGEKSLIAKHILDEDYEIVVE